MSLIPVPYGLKVCVRILRKDGLAFVEVHAPLYMRKKWIMSHCYDDAQFTDAKILNDSDFIRVMSAAFGRRTGEGMPPV